MSDLIKRLARLGDPRHEVDMTTVDRRTVREAVARITELEAENDHVIAVDVSCSCGAERKGLWSGEEADEWAEEHQHLEATDHE